MKKLALVLMVCACGGSDRNGPADAAHVIDVASHDGAIHDAPVIHDAPADSSIVIQDAPILDAPPGVCNVLTQTGCAANEKCTWIVDQVTPAYVGHIGCAPDGVAAVGAACQYGNPGATGYDNCVKGNVCSAYTAPAANGVCKAICDNAGGVPACDMTHACVTYSQLFTTGPSSPAAAGVCDQQCDPLADNDFDGSGSALARTGSACGSANVGCYGAPSQGTPPATAFTCTTDIHYGTPLTHRTECTQATGCVGADNALYLNACNQGYEPLFFEATGVNTVVCVAMCKPINCYAGHCGTNDSDAHGAAPHRCQTPDALGNFGSGENCEYLWAEEVDQSNNYLPSQWSNAVGFCFDHTKYKYDPNMGNNPTIPYPTCQQLQLTATGTDPNQPLTFFSAADFGCVDSTTAGHFTGKRSISKALGFRAPYHRTMR